MKIKVIIPVVLTWVIYIGICFGVFYMIKENLDKKHGKIVQTEVESTEQQEIEETEEQVATEEVISHSTDNPLVLLETGEVKELIEQVLKAMSDGDVKKLKELDLYKEAYADANAVKKASEIVEKYNNIKIYSKNGLDSSSYIIFVVVDMKVKGCETLAPGMFRFYVVQDERDNWHINTAPVEEMESDAFAHMHSVQNDEDVLKLMENVNKAFTAACKKDENLKKLVGK